MTRDDIIRMAREAEILVGFNDVHPSIERFAELVAAAERWKIKQAIEEEMTDELDDQSYHLCMELISKILKRGKP